MNKSNSQGLIELLS